MDPEAVQTSHLNSTGQTSCGPYAVEDYGKPTCTRGTANINLKLCLEHSIVL